MDADPWKLMAQALGVIAWQPTPPTERYVEEDHRGTVDYRGIALRLRRCRYYPSSGRGGRRFHTVWATALAVSIGPRPLMLGLTPGDLRLPRVDTGDPAFDERFRLAGAPPDVLRSVFTPELRARFVASPYRTWMHHDDGHIHLAVDEIVSDGHGGARELQMMADLLVDVSQRICGEWDRQAAEAARQGPQAAAAWQRAQEATLDAARAYHSALRKRVIGAIVVGCLVLIAAAASASLAW
jgi:hypothetical protein